MKKIFTILFIVCTLPLCAEKYDIKNVLYKESVDFDTKAIDNYGSMHTIEYILRPTQIDEGRYEVSITRVDSNIYRIDGTNFYIETQFCYEYCYGQNVILKIVNYKGYSFGTVYFENSY